MSVNTRKFIFNSALLLSEWDEEKNNLLNLFPETTALHSNKKVWWKCEKGHSWSMSPEKRLKSNGCPYCLNKRVLVGYNDLKTLFPKLAQEWDYNENKIDINSVVIGSARQIHWICSKCSYKWSTSMRSRTQRAAGCPQCAIQARAPKRIAAFVAKNGAITDPILLADWDHEKNEKLHLFPDKLTSHSNKKVWWKCATCGYCWEAKICNRSNGRSCPLCSKKVIVPGINDLCTTHPALVLEWDYEESGALSPQNVSYGMGKKVHWKCPIGHKYQATLLHRSSGTGCPICISGRQTSFAEQAFFYYIKQVYPNAINRYRDIFDNGMEIDIFIPDIHYGIEYDGSFWHKSNKYVRERKKHELCKSKGIYLIRIKAIGKAPLQHSNSADETLFLKEDSILDLEILIKKLLIQLINANENFKNEPNTIPSVDLERDRNKISTYMCVQRDSFEDVHPELAQEWHPKKNEELMPNMFKSGSSFSAWWLCRTCGHEWKTSIYHRAKGSNCPKCEKKSRSEDNHYKSKKIYQYTKDGALIREWDTISKASHVEKVNRSNIGMCANGQRAYAGGYRWSFERFENLPPILKQKKSKKGCWGIPVIQLDLQKNIVNSFISLSKAEEKTGIDATSISKAIHGHIKTAGGFLWELKKK